MGVIVRYVQTKKTGRLEFRRAIPEALRPHLGGRREILRSLEATSLREPGAMERYQEALAQSDLELSLARKAQAGEFDYLDDSRASALAEAYKVQMLGQDDAKRALGQADPEMHDAAELGFAEMLEEGDKRLGLHVRYWGEDAQRIAATQGWRLDPTTDAFARLCRSLCLAAIEANDIRQGRDAGKPLPTPAASPPVTQAAPVASKRANGSERTFEEIAESILTNERLRIGPATVEGTRTALRRLKEALGDIRPSDLGRAQVTEFLDLLAKRPANLKRTDRRNLRELAAAYEGKEVPRVSGKTLKQTLGFLSAIWGKAVEEGHLVQLGSSPENPFKRKIAVAPLPEAPQELSLRELNALFALPVFTRGERPTQGRGEACYWIPLLLLWTGARPEEVAQLMVDDFLEDEEGRAWLKFTSEGVHPVKGPRSLKTDRTQTGRRQIYVPKPLIQLGLLDYVQHLRAEGETALFPRLTPKKRGRELFPSVGEWWARYVRAGVDLQPTKGRKVSRELRHVWTTAARASGIPQDAREYIQGHVPKGGSMNDRYGDRKPLGRQIDNLRFEGLDLSGVKKWAAPSPSSPTPAQPSRTPQRLQGTFRQQLTDRTG